MNPWKMKMNPRKKKPNDKIETALKWLNFAGIKYTIRDITSSEKFWLSPAKLNRQEKKKKSLDLKNIQTFWKSYKLDLFFVSFVSELVHCFWQDRKTNSEVSTKAIYKNNTCKVQ